MTAAKSLSMRSLEGCVAQGAAQAARDVEIVEEEHRATGRGEPQYSG